MEQRHMTEREACGSCRFWRDLGETVSKLAGRSDQGCCCIRAPFRQWSTDISGGGTIGNEAATALTDLHAKLKATEPTIPPPTCPSIDKAIAALEELRLDNSQLRYGIGHYQVLNDELKVELSRLKALLAEACREDGPIGALYEELTQAEDSGLKHWPISIEIIRSAAALMEKINAVK